VWEWQQRTFQTIKEKKGARPNNEERTLEKGTTENVPASPRGRQFPKKTLGGSTRIAGKRDRDTRFGKKKKKDGDENCVRKKKHQRPSIIPS